MSYFDSQLVKIFSYECCNLWLFWILTGGGKVCMKSYASLCFCWSSFCFWFVCREVTQFSFPVLGVELMWYLCESCLSFGVLCDWTLSLPYCVAVFLRSVLVIPSLEVMSHFVAYIFFDIYCTYRIKENFSFNVPNIQWLRILIFFSREWPVAGIKPEKGLQ